VKASFYTLLFALFAIATTSQATDVQQTKIKQLDKLFQNYTEKNNALRGKSQSLKAQLVGIEAPLHDQVTNTELNCDADPTVCDDQDLCEKATYGLLGTRNWKVDNYVIFVDEAKTRDLSCGVASNELVMKSDDTVTVETKSKTVEATAKQKCEADIAGCNETDLCETATYGPLDNKRWKVENYIRFIEEAARRDIDCGVSKSANDVLDEAKAQTEVAKKANEPVAEVVRSNAREICDESFDDCRTAELCQIATYNQAGAIRWKIGNYQKYVDELRKRSETCGVLDEEQILSHKSDQDLCTHATHQSSTGKRWNVGSREIFIEQVKRYVTTEKVLEEVKRRGLSCNVQNEDLIDLDVAQIQTRLHRFGYEPGLVDGVWGKKTKAAFQQFLNDNYQLDLSPNSLTAETFLYDLHEEIFGPQNLTQSEILNQENLAKLNNTKQLSLGVTLHDVGGWHGHNFRKSNYQSSIDRIVNYVSANKITIVDTFWITDISTNSVNLVSSGKMSPSPGEIRVLGKYAKSHGIKTEILVGFYGNNLNSFWPILEAKGKSDNRMFWDHFFEEYKKLILKRTRIAADANIDSIILDHKTIIARAPVRYWVDLIKTIRFEGGFKGKIGYLSALSLKRQWSGFDDLREIKGEDSLQYLFSLLDFIGFEVQDVYDERSLAEYLITYKKYKKPVHLMITTPSVDDGDQHTDYVEPGGRFNTNHLIENEQTQANAYERAIRLFENNKFDFLAGINSWGYALNDDLTFGQSSGEAAYEKSASIRCQLAEEVLAYWYKKLAEIGINSKPLRYDSFKNIDWRSECRN
jgi:hypothetical protein